MNPFALKYMLGFLITPSRFCFTQTNVFAIKCALCTLQSLKSDALVLKSHSMQSHKLFHTQGTRNSLNDFIQAFQLLSLANKPLNIPNTQVIFLNSKHLQTSQIHS